MTQEQKKRAAAEAALAELPEGGIIGVGTGSTANHFIDALADRGARVDGAVASSIATAERLEGHGFRLLELEHVASLPIYVDGADEATPERWLIKGGGGALTREKIVAAASRRFVCIVDDSKLVDRLGAFPLPIEVIPLACALVRRQLEQQGARVTLREGFTTDDGNPILDVAGLGMSDPVGLETELNQLSGVVSVGLFCRRPADLLLVGTDRGVERYGG